jgi:ribulose-5-phosphate 4-epimerase/fuculose-1-phosphate aldolase
MNISPLQIHQCVREQVSATEWEVRVNLAACYRLMHEFGMVEMVANHISARIPGADNEFLINPYGMLYDEITASSLIKIDLDGNVLFNASGYGFNRAGYVIHSAVHGARHDVDCVIHSHTLAGMTVSAQKQGLLPIAQSAMRFSDIAYHEYEGLALRLDERERLVQSLGDREALVLRNHGLLTVGDSIPECFNNHYRLERACQLQVMALSCNTEIRLPPEDVVQSTYHGFSKNGEMSRRGLVEWPSLLRRLDRMDPSYAS